jgi:hypothetical protein
LSDVSDIIVFFLEGKYFGSINGHYLLEKKKVGVNISNESYKGFITRE